MEAAPAVILTIVLLTAVSTDLRFRRIPNWLTFSTTLVGLALGWLLSGMDGLLFSLQGVGVGLALMLLPFMLGWTGAGDVKLMVAIGAMGGPSFVFLVCLYAAIVGGLMAVVVLLRRHKLRAAFIYIFLFWRLPGDYRSSLAAGSIPYAPAIAVGALFALAPAQMMPLFTGWTIL